MRFRDTALIVLFVMIVSVGVLACMVYVVPQITRSYTDLNTPPPVWLKLLVRPTAFVAQHWWWLLPGLLIGALMIGRAAMRTKPRK